MTSDVDICNRALSAIGTRSTIQALTEISAEALNCIVIYAGERDDLLRKYRWGFATRRGFALALLQAAAGTPENADGTSLPLAPVPYNYAYAYPSDCLQARRIVPLIGATAISPPLTTGGGGPMSPDLMLSAPAVRFEVVQIQDARGNPVKAIATNQSQALLDYTVATTNANLFDVDFVTALVGRMAARLVIPLAGDKELAKMAMQSGATAEAVAAGRDANERLVVHNHIPSWLRARGYEGDFGVLGAYADTVI